MSLGGRAKALEAVCCLTNASYDLADAGRYLDLAGDPELARRARRIKAEADGLAAAVAMRLEISAKE